MATSRKRGIFALSLSSFLITRLASDGMSLFSIMYIKALILDPSLALSATVSYLVS